MHLPQSPGPIGVFDSGYGGLTILHGIRQLLPEYDYLYLGDNARAPYGSRSFDVVYQFTRQAVLKLFSLGCHLVILGCNTASAKALRSIQQRDLPEWDPARRVLGIIRPTAEAIDPLTSTRHVGLLATEGTVRSDSYKLEIQKLVLKLASEGKSVTFISSEIDEMLHVCKRLIVMRDRHVVGELTGGELTQTKIMSTIAGGEKK